uniref:myb-like protein P n=1 Tax=Erigeron canadensis TaxID=72917 RepID=UPI001CB9CCA6|nr:myb-like protein P [Erigeron canadensis]
MYGSNYFDSRNNAGNYYGRNAYVNNNRAGGYHASYHQQGSLSINYNYYFYEQQQQYYYEQQQQQQYYYELEQQRHHYYYQQQQKQQRRRRVVTVNNKQQTESEDSINPDAPLSVTSSSISSTSFSRHVTSFDRKTTNLDRFLRSVTPIISSRKMTKMKLKEEAGGTRPYYRIGDLWNTFQEWSCYGTGVPFVLFGRYPITQYYVPYLSGMQLYIDPHKSAYTRVGGVNFGA